MNIFILDSDPEIAAQMLMDKHVVKMALETAQILSTINGGPYRATHERHPCVLWAKEAIDNYNWLVKHGIGICNEYRYRYNKEHKSEEIIFCLQEPVSNIEIPKGSTPHVQCMPDQYKSIDPVKAYQEYYKSKASFANWSKRGIPKWWDLK